VRPQLFDGQRGSSYARVTITIARDAMNRTISPGEEMHFFSIHEATRLAFETHCACNTSSAPRRESRAPTHHTLDARSHCIPIYWRLPRTRRVANHLQRKYLLTMHFRSTFPRPDEPTARARTARSTPSTRSPVSSPTDHPSCTPTESQQSTRLERLRCSPRESVVMIVSRAVTEVRPSPSSTRGPRPPRRLSSV
jgi:hypothetical protein